MTFQKVKDFRFFHFLLACAIIAPKIYGIDYSILFLLIDALFVTLLCKKINNWPNNYFFIVIMWLILLALTLTSLIFLGTVDVQFLLKPGRQIVLLTLMLFIADRIQLRIEHVFKIILFAALINCIIIAVQLIGHNYFKIPGFMLPVAFNLEVDAPFRKPGLMSGYPHAGLLSLIAMQCLLYFYKRINRLLFVLFWSIFSISLIVTSRTALILGIIPHFFLLFLGFRSKKALGSILLFLSFGLSLIVYIINMLPEDTFTHSFELFLNYSENKSFSTLSTDASLDSYMWPQKTITWFLGNGKYMTNDYNLNVDDGFQIPFYGGGLIYLILILYVYFWYFYKSISRVKPYFKRVTIFSIFFIVFIANAKLDTIFTRVISDILTMFLALGLYSKFNQDDYSLSK